MAQDMTLQHLYIEDFKMKKRYILRIFCFIFLVWLLLHSLERLFITKTPEYMMMDEFLALERDSVDLLCIGSSYAYTSFDTEVYWNKYGIPSFCISGPSQPISYSYSYLKYAFKIQHPKVVLLEGSCMGLASNDYEYGNVVNTAWMPYSKERADVLQYVMHDAYRSNMEWNLNYFHRRWSELSYEDFHFVLKNNRPKTKGFNPWWNYEEYSNSLPVYATDYYIEPDVKTVEYVDKIITLCEEQGAKLVVYLSPHDFDENTYGIMNWYRNYLTNHNIEMIDGVQLSDELGIDPKVDMSLGHVSYTGAVKLSDYIGNYLSKKQYVVDRRSEKGRKYEIWEEWSHYYENTAALYMMINVKGTEEYINALPTLKNSIVVMEYRGGVQEEQIDEGARAAIRNVGLDLDFSNNIIYISVWADGVMVDQFQTAESIYDKNMLDHHLEIVTDAQNAISILVDNERITKPNQVIAENVLQIFVYNAISGKLIESRTLNLIEK